jgi:hypothetical protein
VPDVETAHLVATSAYAGFQWVIRVVVYPQLAEVSRADFPGYLDAYQRRVTYLVAPLFAALVVTTALVVRSSGPYLGKVAAVALLAALLGLTGFAAVPLHRRLSARWDAAAHRRLMQVDAVRVAVATANVGVAMLIL